MAFYAKCGNNNEIRPEKNLGVNGLILYTYLHIHTYLHLYLLTHKHVLTQINSIYKFTYTNQSDPIFDSKQNAQIATQLTLTTSL